MTRWLPRLASRFVTRWLPRLDARRRGGWWRAGALLVGWGVLAVVGLFVWDAAHPSTGLDGWRDAGPQVFLDQVQVAPGGTVVAGGSGLWLDSSGSWHHVGPFSAYNIVMSLELPASGPVAAYVGSSDGLYAAASLGGSYHLILNADVIHSVVTDPADPSQMWASSAAGFWRSLDGGRSWAQLDAGIAQPDTAWALAYSGGRLYSSAGDAVDVWSGSRWLPSSNQYGVVALDPGPGNTLFASSMGDGVRALEHGTWSLAEDGLTVRDSTGAHVLVDALTSSSCGPEGVYEGPVAGIHVVSVASTAGGVLYAGTMLDGIDVSSDLGRAWSAAWPGLARRGVVWQVLPVGNELLAATDSGLVSLPIVRPSLRAAGSS